jgi:hypothetical protein
MSNITSTQENIQEIFKILHISKVVYVDDDIIDIGVEDIIYSTNRDKIIEQYFPEIKTGDKEIENNQLREYWGRIDDRIKGEINTFVRSNDQNISEVDKKAIPAFSEIIPEGILFSLSPSRWEEEKDTLLQDRNITLFLFDQDLKVGGRGDDGINIIKEISKNPEIMSGLLTQTVTEENCMQHREQLSKNYDISEDKFFVIPKESVTNNLPLFVYLLKLTILAKNFILFKTSVNIILESVNIKTSENIKNIGVEDFDHIFFKVPGKEGLWEPDMFFRIFSSFQRKEFNRLACLNTDLQKSISKIGSVNGISTKPVSFLIPSKAWDMQHDEFYDDAEYLNKNHLPVELGDIFEKTAPGSTNKYILLTQPCDLMIRPDTGRRARDANRFALLRIQRITGEQEKNPKDEKIYKEKIQYLSKEEEWVISFKDVFLVKDCILDLCAYNDDGVSRYTLNSKLSDDIRPSLKKRYDKIIDLIKEGDKAAQRIIKGLKEQQGLNTEKLYKSVYETIFRDDFFKSKYEKNGDNFALTFNCKRTGRLIYERAAGLLAEYYSVIQRPAFEPDYGKSENDE